MAKSISSDKQAPSPHTTPQIAVSHTEQHLHARAVALASELNLPHHDPCDERNREAPELDYLLQVDEQGLAVVACDKSHGPVRVDFVAGKNAHRRQFGGGRKQPLARALGIGRQPVHDVVDATAGLGADAFVMATLGLNVTLLEQSAILAVLLNQAINDSYGEPGTVAITQRMTVIQTNAIDWLTRQKQPVADVIYLDPMYPARGKSARVKKGMQLLHRLVGPDLQGEELLTVAVQKARKRVVVKRPADTKPLLPDTADLPARHEIRSPNTRYDLYSINP